MRYTAAIFDLDGTVLNTLEDLQTAMNHALTLHGMPPRTLKEVRRFVGNGNRVFTERSVPAGTDPAVTEQVFQEMMAYYLIHCRDKTRPYEGIPEMLVQVREAGILTAVVTNKTDTAAQQLIADLFPGLFDCVIGARDGIPIKPAPDCVYEALRELRVSKEKAVYIGDSEVDVATGRNAGLDMITVTWGFRDVPFLREQGATLFMDSPKAVANYLCSEPKLEEEVL